MPFIDYIGNMRLSVVILFILLIFNNSFAKNISEILVKPYKVEQREFYYKFTSIGRCTRGNSIDYHAKKSGVIETIIAKEGEQIKAGELILTMDDSVAKSKLKYLESSLKNAQTSFNRSKQLVKQNILSNKQSEEAEVELNKKQHEYSQTLKEYNDMIITSPIDGRIGVIEAVIGQNINVGDYLFSIIGGSTLHVIAELPESFSNQISYDTEVTLSNSNGEIVKGQVISYSFYITENGTLPVKIQAKEENNFLHGSYLKIEFRLNKHIANAVPETAILKNDNGNFVYKIGENSIVEQVYVNIGIRNDNMCEVITNNLKESDLIVLDGLTKVHSGSKVQILN